MEDGVTVAGDQGKRSCLAKAKPAVCPLSGAARALTGMSMKGGTKRKPELRGLGGSGGGDRRTCESKVSYVYCLTERKRGWEGNTLLHWRGRGADDPVRSTELAQLTEST